MELEAEESIGSASDSSSVIWLDWFLSLKGNELFCDVDEEYILDRFNLAGLNAEVKHYSLAYDLITDSTEKELDAVTWDEVEKSAKHLYGLIHARYVLTSRGLAKMAEKVKIGQCGKCPRVLCHSQSVIPIGLSDVPGVKGVKLYCPKCEDIYCPVSRKHGFIDGAYFGTSMAHLLLQMFPVFVPQKSTDRYIPRIFGFKLKSVSQTHILQDEKRQEQARRLENAKIEE